jgi:nitrite reductase (cytochrome c-552)
VSQAARGRIAVACGSQSALLALIDDTKSAKEAGAADEALTEARRLQRRGQFYVDFVESENSNGFHAPGEAARILGEAIDAFRRGQVSLRPVAARR